VLPSKDDYAASGISFVLAGDGALRDRAKRAAIADYLARQRRALAWGLAHPDQWIAAAGKESRLPEAVIRGARIAQRIELVPITAQIVAQEQRLADILARHGVVKAVRVGPLVENLLR
jgi:sulfonate transport system substrate-binding protein